MPVVVYTDDSKKEDAKATSLTDEHQRAEPRMVLVMPRGPPRGLDADYLDVPKTTHTCTASHKLAGN